MKKITNTNIQILPSVKTETRPVTRVGAMQSYDPDLNNSSNLNLNPPLAQKTYDNALLLKKVILADNRGLSGIYRWVNKLNNKTYVGSGMDLANRLACYYRNSELTRNKRPIHKALLKYGHDNFILEILECCTKGDLLNREQFYLDLLNPEYNVLEFAYSLLGYKHTKDNIELFKLKTISDGHKQILSLTHKGKVVSEETKKKLSLATTEYKKNNPLTSEALANIKVKTIEREGVAVVVTNTHSKEVLNFTNQTEAGEFLGVTRQAVYNAIKRGKPLKGVYLITKKAAN